MMEIHFDFPFYLTLSVIVTGIISLIDVVWLANKRDAAQPMPKLIEYARSFFPALLLVWGVRSFLVQPYRVPTGSLEPTVMPGDFIAVKQYAYGIKLPVTHTQLVKMGVPQTGDVALFFWPVNTELRFVKRVIGIPGDHIVYKDKVLTINGTEMTQELVGNAVSEEPGQLPSSVIHKIENLNGIKHDIFMRKTGGYTQTLDVTVPKGQYFMMGDNRDDSDDSRFWGFVPEENFIGKAFGVWLSWDSNSTSVRWHRIGIGIH